jgi:hypothetical protein
MDNKKKTYEEVTDYIKNVSPLLENPEALTQTIMDRIERINRNKKKYTLMRVTGLVAGIAVCLLLCRLTYESAQLSTYCVPPAKTEIFVKLSDRRPEESDKLQSRKTGRNGIINEYLKRKSIKEQMYLKYVRKLSNYSKY